MKFCKIKCCSRKSVCLGFCKRHYERYREGKRGAALSKPVQPYISRHVSRNCIAFGCERKNYGNGYCQNHYSILWKTQHHQEMKLQLVVSFGEKCTDCTGIYPLCAFDFDNIEDPENHVTVGRLISNNVSWDRIAEEASKCELVCSNCHRVRTQSRHHKRWTELGV